MQQAINPDYPRPGNVRPTPTDILSIFSLDV
jgi:hypothetical protein